MVKILNNFSYSLAQLRAELCEAQEVVAENFNYSLLTKKRRAL